MVWPFHGIAIASLLFNAARENLPNHPLDPRQETRGSADFHVLFKKS
jgi:hypothetical protein